MTWITHNFWLKVLSLTIALGLWSFVNLGERTTEEAFKVPVVLTNISTGLMVTSPRVDYIDVLVSGPRTLLRSIDHGRLGFTVDMDRVRAGHSVFSVEVAQLNLPRGVRPVRVSPAQISLDLEEIDSKTALVQLVISHEPGPDYTIESQMVVPESVVVTGPVSLVNDLESVATEPLDLREATVGRAIQELPLVSLGELIAPTTGRVTAEIEIADVIVSREFESVPVDVLGTDYEHSLTPSAVRISVSGPRRLVLPLELTPGVVTVQADAQDAASATLKPTIQLPEGVELVSIVPEAIELTLFVPTPTPTAPVVPTGTPASSAAAER